MMPALADVAWKRVKSIFTSQRGYRDLFFIRVR